MNHRRHAWHAADGGLAVHVEASRHDQPHRQRHDQRLHSEDRHAHPVDEPDRDSDEQPQNDAPRDSIWRLAGHDVSGGGGYVRDGEVDPTCDDDQRLARGEDAERSGEFQDVRYPVRIDRAGANDLDQAREGNQQSDQDQDRMLLHEANRRHGPGAHTRLSTAPRPPIMTTITIRTPWIIWP